MSALEMALASTKLPYQRLIQEGGLDDGEERQRGYPTSRSSCRFKRVSFRRRFRLKVPSLRRFLRRKGRLVSSVGFSFTKVLKRLKESRAHFGDLFAGNYLFMQVNPSLKCSIEKSCQDHDFNRLLSRYSLAKVA